MTMKKSICGIVAIICFATVFITCKAPEHPATYDFIRESTITHTLSPEDAYSLSQAWVEQREPENHTYDDETKTITANGSTGGHLTWNCTIYADSEDTAEDTAVKIIYTVRCTATNLERARECASDESDKAIESFVEMLRQE